jgi:hypothetical protein
MHEDCLRHRALVVIHDRLGKDTPQIFDGAMAKTDCDANFVSQAAPEATGNTTIEAAIAPNSLPVFTPPSITALTHEKDSKGDDKYRGLFQATIQLERGPLMWQIEDLRKNISGAFKEWLERSRCLSCGSLMD